MHCPNCGKNFDSGNQCPYCQIDAVLFKGTERMSNRLYNEGLERLHSMDYTHGIQALTRSVAINKHNIMARNLLGLALFEIGHIGDALKHWVISQSQLRENNPAKDYLERINKNTRKFEQLNEAVVLYNRALEYLRQDSDDLAVIQLKKSLEFNPRFLDALNLLTLCYLQQRNRQQANVMMERVFSVDARNPIALRNFSIINPGGKRSETRRSFFKSSPAADTAGAAKTGDASPFKTIAIKEKKTTYFHIVGILSFLIGAACMLAFGLFLYLPGIERSHTIALRDVQRDMDNAALMHQQEMGAHAGDISRMYARIDEINAELETWQEQYTKADRIIRVFLANTRYIAGEMEDLRAAVDMLEIISLEGLPVDTVAMALEIIESAQPRLATFYALGGIESFNASDYDRALIQLQDARRFIAPYNPQYPHMLYFLGTLYYRAPARQEEAIETLLELTNISGYADFPANPWNARRTRVTGMLENMGVNPNNE
ncbi:MAG: hypothetical protein FWC16_04660 [Defluviitaleaceae bacterium]|nr:hypothetical protein [Defluviitaleaceae bacterium]MCL2274198.1 hypothetical protein [Defluviitaleaceae bacterium]